MDRAADSTGTPVAHVWLVGRGKGGGGQSRSTGGAGALVSEDRDSEGRGWAPKGREDAGEVA